MLNVALFGLIALVFPLYKTAEEMVKASNPNRACKC